jgi:hypothetical protein
LHTRNNWAAKWSFVKIGFTHAKERSLKSSEQSSGPLAAALEGKIPLCQTVLVLSGDNMAPALIKQGLSSQKGF